MGFQFEASLVVEQREDVGERRERVRERGKKVRVVVMLAPVHCALVSAAYSSKTAVVTVMKDPTTASVSPGSSNSRGIVEVISVAST